ncbi:tandem-95 repeat protein, partial [bacterium]|nr:tandem-95 repeat protein [bacterium]
MPNSEFAGVDTLTYTVRDDNGGVSNETIIRVFVNDPPLALNDTTSTVEEGTVTIAVLANDSDSDGAIAVSSLAIHRDPMHGSATVDSASGEITYAPDVNFAGQDTLNYSISDDEGAGSNIASVFIQVAGVNDPPVANRDTVTTAEDVPVIINVSDNDTDLDGTIDRSSVVIVIDVANGQTTVNDSTGTITYRPDAQFAGADSLRYSVSDDSGAVSNIASVSIRVTGVNDPPVARNDTTNTSEDTPVSVTVLQNDFDIDGLLDSTAVSIVQDAKHGTTSVQNSTGVITYAPNTNFVGSDSLSYKVLDDSSHASNVATVYLQVAGLNDVPVARDDTTTTAEDTEILIAVLDNDEDVDDGLNPSSVQIINSPSHGTATSDSGNGRIVYRPIANYEGSDSFTYQVSDSAGDVSNDATVFLTITAVNDAPIAGEDSSTVLEDDQVVINVLANDRDVDGSIDPATVTIVANPTNGVTSVNESGEVTYIPNANFNGLDSFVYQVADNAATHSNEATISVLVTGVNDAPVAHDDSTSTDNNSPVVIAVTSDDVDVDGNLDSGSVSIIKNPLIGTTAVDNATGAVTYSPTEGLLGGDRFTYRIFDTDGLASDIATVVVHVDGNNNSPVADNDDAMTFNDVPVVIPVISNDSDSDGVLDLSSLSITTNGTSGIAEVIGVTGNIVYTPSSGFLGTDSFTYTVRDNGNLSSNPATVSIEVHASRLTFTPSHDAHVRSNSPGSNYGNASEH